VSWEFFLGVIIASGLLCRWRAGRLKGQDAEDLGAYWLIFLVVWTVFSNTYDIGRRNAAKRHEINLILGR